MLSQITPVDASLNWAGQLGALAGTLFLFVCTLALAIYKIARWYMVRIAEPESIKRINLIDQLASSIVTITQSIKTIVDNTTAVSVAIGRMEEKLEENQNVTKEANSLARKLDELRPQLATKNDLLEIIRKEITALQVR